MNAKWSSLLLCFLIAPAQLIAEPDTKVRWLMNEPASLFDLGIYQMREFLDSSEEQYPRLRDRPINLVAYYVWEENRIYVVASTVDAAPVSEVSQWCESVFYRLTAITLGPQPYGMLNFSHHGSRSGDRPADLEEHLNSLTILVAMAPISENGERPKSKGICERPFDREAFSFRSDELNWWPGSN